MAYHNITPHTMSLIPTQRINPTNDHRAERSACFLSFVWIYSPINAPAIGQKMRPNGGKRNNQAINHIVDHTVPALVHPNFLVHHCGIV